MFLYSFQETVTLANITGRDMTEMQDVAWDQAAKQTFEEALFVCSGG